MFTFFNPGVKQLVSFVTWPSAGNTWGWNNELGHTLIHWSLTLCCCSNRNYSSGNIDKGDDKDDDDAEEEDGDGNDDKVL